MLHLLTLISTGVSGIGEKTAVKLIKHYGTDLFWTFHSLNVDFVHQTLLVGKYLPHWRIYGVLHKHISILFLFFVYLPGSLEKLVEERSKVKGKRALEVIVNCRYTVPKLQFKPNLYLYENFGFSPLELPLEFTIFTYLDLCSIVFFVQF